MRIENVIALTAAMFAASGACAQLVEVLYSSAQTSASSNVPGISGLKFSSFDRPNRSPGGTKYIMLARTDSGSAANDAVYMVGDTDTGLASVVVREGVTQIEVGRVAENMSERRAGVIDNGDFAIVLDLVGTTTNDRIILKSTNSVRSIPIREGNSLFSVLPGVFVGSTITDVTLNSDGDVAARFDNLTGSVTTSTNSAIIARTGTLLVAREGVTVPSDQLGSEFWSAFDLGNFGFDDSNTAILRGTLTGPAATNQVFAVNNQVILQEGVARDEFPSPVLNIIAARLEPNSNGSWFARGELADDTAFVMRDWTFEVWAGPDGSSPVPGVPGETFSNSVWNTTNANTFFMGVANNTGDFVIGGFTSSLNQLTNAVWTLNNESVFMRRGVTAVDLNGNGLADDNAFVGLTGLTGASLNNITDGGFLTDDGWFYFIGDVVDSSGILITSAFMRVRAFETGPQCPPCAADYDNNGGVDGGDLAAFFTDFEAGAECADVDGNGGVDGGDLGFFFQVFEAGGC